MCIRDSNYSLKDTFYRRIRQGNGLIRIGMNFNEIADYVDKGKYNFVAISSNFTPQTNMALKTAEAIKEMNEAGVDKKPQFKPSSETKVTENKGSMELSELDTDSMLGTSSSSIGSLSLGSGSGGVKVMGGESSGISSAPTFEMSKDIPSFEEEKKPVQFKAVDKEVPKFKPAGEKKQEKK